MFRFSIEILRTKVCVSNTLNHIFNTGHAYVTIMGTADVIETGKKRNI
jgi:hypothetical protein